MLAIASIISSNRRLMKVAQEVKVELQLAGVWKDFIHYRDKLNRESGLKPAETTKLALAKFRGEKNSLTPPTPEGADPSPVDSPLPPPACLKSRRCSEVESIRWAADNIDEPEVDPETCPGSAAWTLLNLCKGSNSFLIAFMQNTWTKLLPSRATFDDDDNQAEVDGKPTIDLIDRLRKASESAKERTAKK